MEGRQGTLAAAGAGRVVQGAHACGVSTFNRRWFGIELEGDNRLADRVTPEQWAALIELCVWLSQNAGLNRSLPMRPHFQVLNGCTDCPGVFGGRVDDLESAVNEAMGAGDGPPGEPAAEAEAESAEDGEPDEESMGARGMRATCGKTEQEIGALAEAGGPQAPDGSGTCSNGWYVTGYFTPVEGDFSGPQRTVSIQGHGSESFVSSFLSKVRIEGWGRTRHGWCIGWYGNRWHRSDEPLDAGGQSLVKGSLARDPDLIPTDAQVTIPSLPAPWNTQVFAPSDTGGAIIGRHVDVYCGEGRSAELVTFQITGHGNRLCYS